MFAFLTGKVARTTADFSHEEHFFELSEPNGLVIVLVETPRHPTILWLTSVEVLDGKRTVFLSQIDFSNRSNEEQQKRVLTLQLTARKMKRLSIKR